MTFEENIAALEEGIKYIKKQHSLFSEGKVDQGQYEINCEDCLLRIDEALLGIRHTYLPIQIPKLLRFPDDTPKWLNISKKGANDYKQIVKDNEIRQEILIRKFKRNGMRKENIERAVKLLQIEQSKLYNAELWKIYSNFADEVKMNCRLNILPAKKAPENVVEDLRNALTELEMSEPQTQDELSLFLASVFGEDGCLEKGIKSKSIEAEVSLIAAAACEIAPNVNKEDVVGTVLPYVGVIHQTAVLENAKTILPDIHKAFDEASSLLGESVSMSDFAEEGTLPDTVKDAIFDCLIYDDMDQLIAKLDQAGKATIRASSNYKQARAMIGTAMLTIQDTRLPQLFFAGLRWCAPNTLNSFQMCPLYLMAFDEITTLIPDFDSLE